MDQANIEARVERLFKEAKPRSRSNTKGYLKLAAALIIATIPLSITQRPGSTPIPEPQIIPAIAEAQDPEIKPTVLDETDETLTITVNQPSTVFFCGCAHTRSSRLDSFDRSVKSKNI